MTQDPRNIVSDEEAERVHGNARFGSLTPRDVLADGVLKAALGYGSGSTAIGILLEHGLIRKPRKSPDRAVLTVKGRKYLHATYGGKVRQMFDLRWKP